MMLDGLQSYIYDRLFPKGQVDYRNGALVRFADDILIVARSKTYAELIMQIVTEFLSERGLRINYEKSYIVNVNQGFDFLLVIIRKGTAFYMPHLRTVQLSNWSMNWSHSL